MFPLWVVGMFGVVRAGFVGESGFLVAPAAWFVLGLV